MKTILKILLPALFLFSNSANAQLEVYGHSMDSIGKIVEANPDLISDLNKKCMNMDSTISKYELFLFYYGSTFDDKYSPYSESYTIEQVRDYLKDEEYDSIIQNCNSAIVNHPGFIKPYYYLGIAYYEKGDTALSGKYIDRYYELLGVPYNSGKGENFENAFVVRSVTDEYLLISEMGYNVSSQALLYDDGMPYDLMTLYLPEDTTKYELYFNVNQPFKLGLMRDLSDVDTEESDSLNNSNDKSEKKRFLNIFRRKNKDK